MPPKRRDGATSFMKLVSYISERDRKPASDGVVFDDPKAPASQSSQAVFDRLVDYIDRSGDEEGGVRVTDEFEDGRQRVLVGEVACETNCFSWETAAAEMNMVAAQNRRCTDAVYHFILSWREHEVPTDAKIFESAQHCLNALGLEGHQYVTAIHQDTDNTHCHVAVNRVSPLTYKAANMWNDAEKLQKCCRVLERRYGFEQDNGSWEWSAQNTLVPAPFRFQPAPQGAAKAQTFSDKESLFHYAERTVRSELDQALDKETTNWASLHRLLHKNGLGIREQGQGLVVYDFIRPQAPPVKASSVHPSLTKSRLAPLYGEYQAPPLFETSDPFEARYGIFETYKPTLQLRDKAVRDERREERAEAREALKARYQVNRNAWVKPDLNVPARQRQIAMRYQAMKASVKRSYNDPLLRKLMYRVAEFDRMKAMAELRIQIRKERQDLSDKGIYRPLTYRVWVEQEALSGDLAAVSQLRGWAYREKRKESIADKIKDRIILCAAADDSPLFDSSSHASQLRRDGTIEYLRYGRVGVVDHGDQIEIKPGFEDHDEVANYKMAAGIVSTKSGERVEVLGDAQFVDQVLVAGYRFNHEYSVSHFPVTNSEQQARYAYFETYATGPDSRYQDEHASDSRVDNVTQCDEDEESPPVWSPRL
ncbi:TraI/MobA(P) family conjugative relaxase [Pseudomonas sp. 10S5]|uniref:TraI/MobA(P) family conjugative relaxase n=1 Tax=Pseudomonas sp. 10S5 TaxID=3048584 RepID=UPI002B225BD2|nr:TraI/MobA(P) family conjugative relaxase [Pseudomonas sp. 10S5]